MKRLLCPCVALLVASPAPAQEDIPIEAGGDWIHERTGTIFPVQIGDLRLDRMSDYSTAQYDVAANYSTADKRSWVTVYFYRAGLPDVSLWAGPVTEIMLGRQGFEPFDGAEATMHFVAPEGSDVASGMRMTYLTRGGQVNGTGVALMQRGDWLFKIRASSTSLNSAELDLLINEVMMSFPVAEGTPEPPSAYQVETCKELLNVPEAQRANEDGAHVLEAVLTATAKRLKGQTEKIRWCREPVNSDVVSLFRPDGRSDAYLLAIRDAGAILAVGNVLDPPSVAQEQGALSSVPVVLKSSQDDTYLALFESTPTPQQAADAWNEGRVLAVDDRADDNRITISPDLLSIDAPERDSSGGN